MRYFFFLFEAIASFLFTFSLQGIDFHSADGIKIPASVSHGDSSGIVAGCVCPISGTFFDQGFSFDVQSSEPLSLSAYYVSSMDEGWALNMFCFVKTKMDLRYGQTRRREPLGVQANYRSPFGSTYQFTANLNIRSNLNASGILPIDLDWAEKGFTNIAEEIGGKTNAKNISMRWQREAERIIVDQSDGSQEEYKVYLPGDVAKFHLRFCEGIYFLDKIYRPSGKNVFLETTPTKFPSKLSLGTYSTIYSWIRLTGLVKTAVNCENVAFEASDGRKLTYETVFLQTVGAQPFPYITVLNHPNQPEIRYSYEIVPNHPTALMTKKQWPDNRYLGIEYYRPGETHGGMVKQLKAPVGQGAEPITTHRFEYHQQNGTGYTDVYNSLNHKTTYSYIDHRLTEISRYQGNKEYTLISKEKNYWGKKGTKDLGNLLCKSYEDNKGNITLAHTYQYDDKGNIIEERIYGNITGNGSPLRINDGKVEGGEYHPKKATYSQDKFHNKLTETEDNITTTYDYCKYCNLPKTKLVQTKEGKIIQRLFYEYGEHYFLIKTITDDGSSPNISDLQGVTSRQITKITPKPNGHCMGYPWKIEQYAYDPATKKEVFLQKIINTYTPEGWIEKQEIYDSNNQHRCTLEKKYHRLGKITQEKDPLGHITVRDFDLNGNLIYEKGPKGDSFTECTYDFSNRRTSQTKVLNTGEILKTTFTYDILGNKITETDPNGHTTYLEYDELGNPIKIIHPATIDEQGTPHQPTETFTYDHLGRMIAKQDARGSFTTTNYNILGKPLEINYPDGTQEKYQYNLNGTLRTEITKNATHIDYEYDDLKRVTRKTTRAQEQTLKTQTYTYNAFHKLSETDPQGITTTFTHDIFGRPKTTTKEGHTTTYEYDPLGNISRITEGNTKVTAFTYDLLGHKIEERIEDHQKNTYKRLQFTYDPEGNITEQIEETPQGQAITQKEYNPFHQLTKITDPLGNTTRIDYEYSHLNSYGQKVERKTEIDPLQNQTITVYDTHKRPAEIYRTNPQGQHLAKEHIYYDSIGNPTLKKEFAIQNHQVEKEINNRWEYNPASQITRLIEASDTPLEKQTTYIYNSYGQRESLTKPDGTTLYYTYDPLGRMAEQHSSDQTIHYQYTYDLNDNLISVYDCNQQQTTTRKYNTHDYLIAETLANGLTIAYQRDSLGRVTIVEYPDGTTANYTYNPLQLTQVTYGPHIHKYYYDTAARLKRTEMIANTGEVHYTHDLSGQLTNIDNANWKQNNLTYDPNGNLIYYTLHDLAGTTQATFTYDNLNQLTSEKGILSHTYAHDSLNNRTRKNDDPYSNNHLNQITQHHQSTYTYDNNGNMTHRHEQKKHQEKNTQYQYDPLDRLISITTETQHIKYTYDPFNRRISRTENEITTHYLYQGNIEIAAYQTGKAIEKRILGQGKQGDIGATIAIQIGNKTYAPIHDHNGNLSALIDIETKQLVQSYCYTAFGEEECYNSSGPTENPISPWRYSSKRKDGTLIHFPYRDYDPELGRWITPDPIGYEDGPNLYAYVHNNPLTHIDHHGLFAGIGRHRNHHHTVNHTRPCHFQHPTRKAGANKPVVDPNFIKGSLSTSGQYSGRTGSEKISGVDYGYMNGIGNSFEDAMDGARCMSNRARGLEVDLTYQQTLGFRKDVQRYQAAKDHFMVTEAVFQLHDKWDRFFDNNPGKDSLYIQSGHSYGMVTVRNALMTYDVERRQQISVIAIAPGAYVEDKYCRSVVHLESGRDPVTHLDREGRKRCAHTIRTLKPHRSAGPIDHSVHSETYRTAVAEEIQLLLMQR